MWLFPQNELKTIQIPLTSVVLQCQLTVGRHILENGHKIIIIMILKSA